ncbi:PA2169 family four-helix-bundle protein [Acidobacteria bacterium AB60]|nr:PA2169 family four-helix-bundle protein [Acidobacteria bacterium AB60]
MGSAAKSLVETEGILRIVIEHLIDGQEGFQKLGESAKDETLKRLFLGESLKRAQFRGELESILHQEGVRDLHETGTAAGAFIRIWNGLAARLTGDDGILKAAEEAEHTVIEAYNDALSRDLPDPVKQVLAEQALWIVGRHNAIRSARENGTD